MIADLKDKGHVTRGYLGVQIQPVTSDLADALGLKQAAGALVAEPQSGSPAAKAGVKAGDVIVSLDGKDIKDARELSQKIATLSPGTSVTLGVMRDGKTQNVDVTLTQMQNQRQANADTDQQDHATTHLGLALAPARETGANREGVVVTAVDPNGPAADHGIQAGDVILNVGGTAVSTPNDVRKQLAEVQKASAAHEVLMRVTSDNGTRYIALPLAAS